MDSFINERIGKGRVIGLKVANQITLLFQPALHPRPRNNFCNLPYLAANE
ncbi:hypothetical protein GGR28_000829 [Lewinella aquimaris]|uniref:Uncharacterized protein n=1 Tax=Neolewinella aquimaris TaxID=1835722 RepID=A0A840E835_9BACT|nr:hypothetical protein [Neolewinella aquimaris]